MTVDFDRVIDRRGTNSLKFDFAQQRGKPADALPLWVADMDFQAPPAVLDALQKAVAHGIFGYSEPGPGYFSAVSRWYARRFGWEVQQDWLVKTPGVVFGIAAVIRALTRPGDGVLIQQPVYYPFSEAVRENRRRLVNSPLVLRNGRYEMDFDDLDRKLAQSKLMILCSPHNPVGRVWTEDELLRVGALCRKHSVIVVADEIHADFVYPGYTHHVFASLLPDYADHIVTCTSPSKTFNLAGLQTSNLFIADPALRRAVRQEINRTGYSQLNALGLVACRAAYEDGEGWLEQLKGYLADNLKLVRETVSGLSGIRLIEPEGTYLVWLDCRGLGLSAPELERRTVEQARLWLDDGSLFGPEGEGFERVNIACPRAVLHSALERLAVLSHP